MSIRKTNHMTSTLHFSEKVLRFLIIGILLPAVVLAQWSTPVNISPNAMSASMNENMGPCIAVSHDTIHVIWSDKRTKGTAIYYTRSVDTGHTWSDAVAITDTMGNATMPSLAVNGSNIHVVWLDNSLANPASCYKHSLDGGHTWSSNVFIDSNTIFWPGVAVSGSTVLVSLNKGSMDSTFVLLTKSTNNGATWGAEQTVSTRTGKGRSEDQATATDGNYIHMSWNDNRSGVMEIYYRRSTDMGTTWDTEVAITSGDSYTTMVFLDSSHVDVAHGFYDTYFNSWLRRSSDSGATWSPDVQVTTNDTAGHDELYPFMVRDGLNIYMVSYEIPVGEWYSQSSDGGATWTPQLFLGAGSGSSFIALTCPVLHIVWPDKGVIYYMRNPVGDSDCAAATGTLVAGIAANNPVISIYPNPVENNVNITFSETGNHSIELYDVTGREINGFISTGKEYEFSCEGLSAGVYYVKVSSGKGMQVLKFVKE